MKASSITSAWSRKWRGPSAAKSGSSPAGYLVIDHTEAMTVIDVNTGRFVGKRDQEETILRNNLEAAKEVAYQVKLRGIGGIIIVDFIDMEREKNRDKVYHALMDAMASDKARTRVSRISDLGLIEISRERVREDLLRSLSEPCHYCEGRGYTKSPTTVAYEIFREIRRIGRSQMNSSGSSWAPILPSLDCFKMRSGKALKPSSANAPPKSLSCRMNNCIWSSTISS